VKYKHVFIDLEQAQHVELSQMIVMYSTVELECSVRNIPRLVEYCFVYVKHVVNCSTVFFSCSLILANGRDETIEQLSRV